MLWLQTAIVSPARATAGQPSAAAAGSRNGAPLAGQAEGMDQPVVPVRVLPAGPPAVWTCGRDWAKMALPAVRGGGHGR